VYPSFVTKCLRKAENGEKEGNKSSLRKHRKEKITRNQPEKTKLRCYVVNIKCTHFIILLITALALKSKGGS